VPQVAEGTARTLPSWSDNVVERNEEQAFMATEEQTLAALDTIVARLDSVDPADWAKHAVERTVSCRVSDLGLAFQTRIHAGGLDPFTPCADPKSAQVRLTAASNDLVALAADELSAARAWASGKLKIEASITDLLRLRKLL